MSLCYYDRQSSSTSDGIHEGALVGNLLFLVGLAVIIVGTIMVLIVAYKESIWWFLGCLFIPFASILFIITHWEETKQGFFWSLAGTGIAVLGMIVSPAVPRTPKPEEVKTPVASASRPVEYTPVDYSAASTMYAQKTETVPPPPPPVDEPAQPVLEKVYADNKSKLYYPKDCANPPANAYLMAKSIAVRQGFKPGGKCK